MGDVICLIRSSCSARSIACSLRVGLCLSRSRTCAPGAPADPKEADADLLDRVIRLSLDSVESAGVWRNAIGPLLRAMLEELGFTDVEREGACWVAADEHPEIMAVITQTLQLAAASALAAGMITQIELEAAIAVMRSSMLMSPSVSFLRA
jgi:hypothetical protein